MSEPITSFRTDSEAIEPLTIEHSPTLVSPAGERLSPSSTGDRSPMDRDRYEQLARLEDKTSRIEEKYARSEALMQRVADKVEIATARMGEVALQSDLAAIRGDVAVIGRRVRGLPGLGGLVVTAVLAAILTAILMIAVLKYAPGLLAR